MEKNKDKSHLIDQLYDYLEEQIQELKTDRNQLNHKMQDMIQTAKSLKITKEELNMMMDILYEEV